MNQRKRHKLQLFYDILRAIEEDMFQNAEARFAKPTHVRAVTLDCPTIRCYIILASREELE